MFAVKLDRRVVAAGVRAVQFHVEYPARAEISNGGETVSLAGRFVCSKPSSVWVRSWVFQKRTGTVAEGRFPVHAATPPQKALADCTGVSRRWSVAAAVKTTDPGRFRAGGSIVCYVIALRAHSRYSSLTSLCAPLQLR